MIFECFREFNPRNDGFVKVRDVSFEDANALFYDFIILFK